MNIEHVMSKTSGPELRKVRNLPATAARGALRYGISLTALAAAIMLPGMALAANYIVSNEADLRQALIDANGDGDLNATITLAANIVVADPTAFIQINKPILIDTDGFSITGAAGVGITAAGLSSTFAGGPVTITGAVAGGNAATVDSRGVGGIGVTLSNGALNNEGSIAGGLGGNTQYQGAAGRASGAGGMGISATNAQIVNRSSGIVMGGTGGNYDPRGVVSGALTSSTGPGGGGVVLTGGSLNNQGVIIAGDGGAKNGPGGNDNTFGGAGGIGAALAGGTHNNSGQITGGRGGAGMNAGGTTGNGFGGAGASVTAGASFINAASGVITGGAGLSGGGASSGGGSGGGAGMMLNGGLLENYGAIKGGNTGFTDNSTTGVGFGVDATTSTIINAGTINSGLRSGGGFVTAINFIGGGNTLELRQGSVINGTVLAGVTDKLILGGAGAATFSSAQIGPAAQYRGFGLYEKTGAGTWTLTDTTATVTPWKLTGGVLQISGDANLGAATGGITFNGGTLNTTATFTSDRDITLIGAGTIDVGNLTSTILTWTERGDVTGAGSLTKTGTGYLTLAGDATHAGGTTITAGTLRIGDGGPAGSIAGDILNNAMLIFNRSGASTYDGAITGSGVVSQNQGVLSLTGDSSFAGGLNVNLSELQITAGNTVSTGVMGVSQGTLMVAGPGSTLETGPITVLSGAAATINVENGGVIRTTTGGLILRKAGPIGTGASSLNISGAGSLVDLAGAMDVAAFSAISRAHVTIDDGGALRSSGANRIGYLTGNGVSPIATVTITGAGSNWTSTGTLALTNGDFSVLDGAAASFTSAGIGTVAQGGSLLVSGANSTFTAGNLTVGSGVGGLGVLTLADAGRAVLGGATVGADAGSTGILNIGGAEGQAAAAAGFLDASTLTFGGGAGRLNFNHLDTDYEFAAAMSGAGSINQVSGDTNLTGNSAGFGGVATVSGGALRVNGVLGDAASTVNVLAGGSLGGAGGIGGSVTVADNGVLAPGNSPGTLTINGDLGLSNGSILQFEFGKANVAGGALNDLVKVGGDLRLDGVININTSSGGSFGPGVYRVFDYAGALDDQGLLIGTSPTTSLTVQTSVAHQVNLVNTAGLALRFWDTGPRNDQLIAGGGGVWQNDLGNENWTLESGAINAGFLDGAFAIFQGAAGIVNVDPGLINVSGMQFSTDGYQINGGTITLAAAESVIRVGDGSAASGGYTATIASVLGGAGQLIKGDEGTLILKGVNTYQGGTTISGGTLEVSEDANLGDVAGDLTFEGGMLHTTDSFTSARNVALDGAGKILTDDGTTLILTDAISGAGALTKDGDGTLVLAGDNDYTGGTTITAGTLQIGNGGATGALVGDVLNNGVLIFNRTGASNFAGKISGSGDVEKMATGTLTLTGNSAFIGDLYVRAGELLLAGGVTIDSDEGYIGGALNPLSTVTVTGAGSTWTTAGILGIGNGNAAGMLNITDGGKVVSTDASIGYDLSGEALVSGAGSLWEDKGTLSVGASGVGKLRMEGGAEVLGEDVVVGGSADGDAVVTGASTSLVVTAQLIVGNGAAGTLRIEDGASVTSNQGYVGVSADGAATVTGSGSSWWVTSASVGIGYEAAGSLTIQGGARVRADGSVRLGERTGSSGTLELLGTSASRAVLETNQIVAGVGGVSLTIDGGLVRATQNESDFFDGFGARDITLGANGGVIDTDGHDIGISPDITGAGALTKDDAGTLTLTGTNNYGGGTTIVAGTLQLGDGGTTGSIMGNVANEGLLAFNRSDSMTFAGLISGSGAVSQDGAGTTILTANNTYAGGTTISDGALQMGAGGTTGSIVGDVVDNGRLIFNRSNAVTFDGLISGTGSIEKRGASTLTLTKDNTYAGGTRIIAGTLILGTNGTTGGIVGNVLNSGTLAFNRSNALNFAGAITGTGAIDQRGDGVTTLTGTSAYTGLTTVSSGELRLESGGKITASSQLEVAPDVNRHGVLSVDGAGSRLVITGSSSNSVGQFGTGILNIRNGGQADLGSLTIGGNPAGNGTVNVDGDGSSLVVRNGISVSLAGTAALNILNGATATNTTNGNIGFAINAGGVGTVTVSGEGSQWAAGNTLNLYNGSLSVLDGGLVTTAGAVNLTSVASHTGVLTIASGGVVRPGSGTLTFKVGTAILNIGGAEGASAAAAGTLDAANVVFGGANSRVNFNHTDADYVFAALMSGAGKLNQVGPGRTILTANNTYTGATTIADGVLQLGNGGTTGWILGNVANDGALGFNRSDNVTFAGLISGSGSIEQIGSGRTTLTANNTLTGGATILDGALQLGAGGTTGWIFGDVIDNGLLAFNRSDDVTFAGLISGGGAVEQIGAGTTILTADNTYTGGTTIAATTLQLGDGGTTGSIVGDVANNGVLAFNRSDSVTLGGVISGSGAVNQIGGGKTILSGANSYDGETTVASGSLFINGDQSLAKGLTAVANGAALGGSGIIGGDVEVADGGVLAPGNSPGTLTINGDLSLAAASTLYFEYGEAGIVGGARNDLIVVGGDLVLDGDLDVAVSANGVFGPGVYRVISYDGALTNNGLELGVMPAGSDLYVQTSIANQVNLVNSTGVTLNFWDGPAGSKNDGLITGGDGVWQNAMGADNWTDAAGALNAPYANAAFAIFSGAAGNVSVDNGLGAVTASGIQFTSDGYLIAGDALTLAGPQSTILVGDGALNVTATIAAQLTGAAQLVKTGAGTLILTGANSYTGGTAINDGVLSVASNANLGDGAGGLAFNGGVLRVTGTAFASTPRAITWGAAGGGFDIADAANTFTVAQNLTGGGALTKLGDGTLVLAGANTYANGTTITAGTLQLGAGGTTGGVLGDIANDGVLAFNRSDDVTFAGVISGAGALDQRGSGATILSADNSYAGGTTISDGVLQLGAGGTTGSIAGDVINNGQLVFNRSNTVTFAGLISGSGAVEQAGSGATVLTGANSYLGATTITAGSLLINGDQTAATGQTSVSSGGLLGGFGTIGGNVDVADGGAIAPGAGAGTLIIKGDLTLAGAAAMNFELGSVGAVGGSLNDLIDVGGDLTLDGAINIAQSAGGLFDIGVYRLINYDGALTNNGLTIGTKPTVGALYVQTSVAQQVNLVNAGVLTLNFWDGAAGPTFDGLVNGGDGVWQNAAGNVSWTDTSGAINAGYADDAFAIFSAAPGDVTVDTGLGAVTASGMQFASDGYVISGDAITLTAPQSVIRVGDGSGPEFTATIGSELTGAAQLVKTDQGTLILTGANSYLGGTAINGGVLSVASDANLGDGAGGLGFDGGVLRVTGTAFANTSRAITWGAAGGGFDIADAGAVFTVAQSLAGGGALTKLGGGTLVLAGANTYADGTTIADGVLQLGDGGTTGSIAGDVRNNGTLVFNRSDEVTFASLISGSGSLEQAGAGTTILTAANNYAGGTTINAGALLINGDQSAAKGVTLLNGGTLGGLGVIGGDVAVADGGAISPGDAGAAPGLLTINGDLSFAAASALNYQFGRANLVGGAFNDLIEVGGDLTLDGRLNVAMPTGGAFAPGLYRVISYDGALTNNGLGIGVIPTPDFYVQTSVDHQVNLVNTAGLTLRYWDGGAGAKNDGVVDGDDGAWQNSTGNDNWTEDTGAINAGFNDSAFAVFMGEAGTVKVDNGLGAVGVSGMQFLTDGYKIEGHEIVLMGGSAFLRVGDGSASSAATTATIAAELAGAAQLVKDDLGALVLSGANSYAGGTLVQAGVLQISSDGNLGAASTGLTIGDGALRTTANIETARLVGLVGAATVLTDAQTTLMLKGVVSGAGSLDKAGEGELRLAAAASYAGDTTVRAGLLKAAAANVFSARSDHAVLAGGTLDLGGQDQTVASLANAGAIRFGGAPGAILTVTGAYAGADGVIHLNAALGGDSSPTDLVSVRGDTSGSTTLVVANVGGAGAQTVEGVKVVDVAGASNGAFALKGDYVFQGQQAVVGGAYGYRLYKNGVSTPADGDWYLRSALLNPVNPTDPNPAPLYQPGVPAYEVYGQALLGLSAVSTLQQRIGNRAGESRDGDGRAVWGRMDGAHNVFEPKTSTSGSTYDLDTWGLQMGLDTEIYANAQGRVIGSVSAHYSAASTDFTSIYGQGQIATDGYGVAGALTWYGQDGAYIDGQAKLSWFDSDLSSFTAARSLADGNKGFGYTLSVEAGERFDVNAHWAIVPQAQVVYSAVDVDTFADTFGARVSLDQGDSLKGRLGFAASRDDSWHDQSGQSGRSTLYGIANLHYEFLDGAMADVSGVKFATANDKLWAGIGAGGTYNWADDKYAFYGEVSLNSSLANFGDSYSVNGAAGFRVKW